MKPLTNLHVVVTRPLAQAEPWAGKLRELGAQTSVIPLLEIVPVVSQEQQQAVKNRVLDLDLYSKVIFVSQNAVALGIEWIENYWPQMPVGIEFFAVGQTTARQLQARGVAVTDLAQAQSGAFDDSCGDSSSAGDNSSNNSPMDSETLLAAPVLQQVAGEKILIFRGVGGRPHLGEVLSERGAIVHYCELYERRQPTGSPAQFAQLLAHMSAERSHFFAITVHSGEALQNLQEILLGLGKRPKDIPDIGLLVPSQRIAELATAAGWSTLVAAHNATDNCMLQGLIELQNTLTKGVRL